MGHDTFVPPLLAGIAEPIKVEGGLTSGTPGWGWAKPATAKPPASASPQVLSGPRIVCRSRCDCSYRATPVQGAA